VEADREEVEEALRRVCRDVSRTTPHPAAGEVGLDLELGWGPTFRWRGGSTGFSGGGWSPGSMASIASVLADQFQSDVELGLGEPWPKCPHHRHELTAGFDPPGTWVCPTTLDVIAAIGSLLPDDLDQWTV
jgi:hypothetical protein